MKVQRYLPRFCVCRGNKGVTGAFRGCRGNKGLSGFFGLAEDVGRPETAQKQRPPQHNLGIIAHYLSVVYYYLVGTSFETGTRRGGAEKREQRPTLSRPESVGHPNLPQRVKPAPPAFVDELSPSNHQVVFFISIYASLSAVRHPTRQLSGSMLRRIPALPPHAA